MTRREVAARPGWKIVAPDHILLCNLVSIKGSSATKKRGQPKYRLYVADLTFRNGVSDTYAAQFDRLGNAVKWAEEYLVGVVSQFAEIEQKAEAIAQWENEENVRLIDI